MTTTIVRDPLHDPAVLVGSCSRRACVLNAGHIAHCRTHYRAGDRVLQVAGFIKRAVPDTVPGEYRSVRYLKATTPCCGVASWEAADHFPWREEHGFDHGRRCGYRSDGSGKRTDSRNQGCGWRWSIEPIHPDHGQSFAEGGRTPIVWIAGRG